MGKNMHSKTLALVLATTSILQVTGIASELVNGDAFVTANALEQSTETITSELNTVDLLATTSSAVQVTTPSSVQVTTSSAVEIATTPAAVIIKGNTASGNTLTAQFLSEDAAEISVTTSSSVSYKWYRLSSKSSNPKLVGEDMNYVLATSDSGKYIKLIASYDGKIFEDSVAIAKSSSSSKSHKKSKSSSEDTSKSEDSSKKDSDKASARWEKNTDGSWKFIENGKPVTGWKQVNNAWYLMDSIGTMQKGWQIVNNKWYLLKDDGAMATGWQNVNNKWYLLNNDGSMAKGWKNVNNKWYFLYDNGSMASNTSIDGYNVDESGAWIE